MAELITLRLIGREDISRGYATFSSSVLDGSTQTFTGLNLSDMYLQYTVSFSATPTFDLVNGTTQTITLTANVTSSTFQNDSTTVPSGARLKLRIVQDGTGGRTFAWPSNVSGSSLIQIGSAASAVTIAELEYNGTNWEFVSVPIVAGTMVLALTSGGAITGTGTANYVPKFTSASVIANSQIYDNGTRVLIGLTTSDTVGGKLVSSDSILVASAATNAQWIGFGISAGNWGTIQVDKTGSGTYLPLMFQVGGAERGRITATYGTLLWGMTSSDRGGTDPYVISKGAFVCATATVNAEYTEVGNVAGSYGYISAGATGTGTARPLVFGTNGTERLRVGTDGRVLHGFTTTDISGGKYIASDSLVVATANANAEWVGMGMSAGNYATIQVDKTGSASYRPLMFNIGGQERARFTTDGQLLIGGISTDIGSPTGRIITLSNSGGFMCATGIANASNGQFTVVSGSYVAMSSSKTGGGSYLPIAIFTGGAERGRVTTTYGTLLWGMTSSDRGGTLPYIISAAPFVSATATANAEYVEVGCLAGSYAYISAGHTGSGTSRDLVFGTDGAERARLKVAGQFMVGGTSSDIGSLGTATILTLGTSNGFICASAATNASYGALGVIAGFYVQLISAKSGSGTILPLTVNMGTTEIVRFYTTGGVAINGAAGVAPTGGDKGAGTINLVNDVYKQGTAYTFPKWALQHYFTGQTDAEGPYMAPEGYAGLRPLDEHEDFTSKHHDLPLMLMKPDGGLFERGDMMLASLEEAYLYLYILNRRIKVLEAQSLKAS